MTNPIARIASALLAFATAAVLAWAGGCASRAAGARRESRPNVVLIVVDALRADRLECYGYSRHTSPSLNALAADGVLFRDAMAQASETTLSIPSLMTGRRPREHGFGWMQQDGRVYARRGAALPVLAEVLREHGYATAAFSANPVVGSSIGVDRGFDDFDYPVGRLPTWRHGSAAEVNRCALAWLRRHDSRAKPFFIYLHYIDPHNLYRPPEEFCLFGRPGYTAEDERANVEMNLVPDSQAGDGVTDAALAKHGLSRRDVARLSDLYDGEVRCADGAIGELVQWVKDAGLYDDTAIIVTADHGEAFLEHGQLEHGGALYQELVHVPLIMRLPGLRGGQEVQELVESIDVAPTVLDAVGLGQAAPMSGRSVYGHLVRGTPIPERVAMAELPSHRAFAVRLGALKLITSPERTELYDLSRDPGERANLAASRPAEVARLQGALHQELARRPAAKAVAQPASKQELEALKALGYIE